RVVLLAVDVAAHAVLLAREAGLLRGRELAVLHGARLVALDARFLALEARRFARGELAGLQALLDALLLVDVALDRAGLRARRAPTRWRPPGSHRPPSPGRFGTSSRINATLQCSMARCVRSMSGGAWCAWKTAMSSPTTI